MDKVRIKGKLITFPLRNEEGLIEIEGAREGLRTSGYSEHCIAEIFSALGAEEVKKEIRLKDLSDKMGRISKTVNNSNAKYEPEPPKRIEPIKYKDDTYLTVDNLEGNIQLCVDKLNEIIAWIQEREK